ncbi:MAG: 3-isopropylmalate dehydratase large subunit [Thermodesulfobacteriota bacterium]|nr:3-isopropylmalate dehydratase large subunit [Thermodesulfobacteriota bacterium]
MGLTITEKILAVHSERKSVEPGELIEAHIDIALGNDITAPLAIEQFERMGVSKVFDREKIVLVPDHHTPNKDIPSAQLCKILQDFAKNQQIKYYFEIGEMGIEHALLPEKGIVVPGDLIIGADSHTCTYGALGAFATGVGSTDLAAVMVTGTLWFKVPETLKIIYHGKLSKWVGGKDLILYTIGKIGVDGALYKAMEFSGEIIENLPMDDRFTMCNMAIEAGAKSGIVQPDKITEDYINERAQRPYTIYSSDNDCKYADTIEIDCSKIEPQIAFPHLPENTKGISQVDTIPIDQAFIGSCTNGRIDDLRIAAKILKGKRVAPYVRLIIIPATPLIYRQALNEGLISIFLDAKAVVSTPTCGPCLGGHMGILAQGERGISTTNRNFVGRMGHPESEVYLASPAVVAASAVLGKIAGPDELETIEEESA